MHQNRRETRGRAPSLGPEAELQRDWAWFEALEAALMPPRCRSWETAQPAVVIGRHGVLENEIICDNCRADRVEISRRFSGGGAVVLASGCLNYTVGLSLTSRPELADVERSFQFVLGTIVEALGLPGLSIAGASDLVMNGRKVSGNAQRRGRVALLHHGTLLYRFDGSLAAKYLKEPVRRPAYRGGRRHAEFLGNIPLPLESLEARLQKAWQIFSKGSY
jgi:lipoate-protein ligase A